MRRAENRPFSQNGDTLSCSELHSLTPKFLCVLSALAFVRPADFPMGRRRPQGAVTRTQRLSASPLLGHRLQRLASLGGYALKIKKHCMTENEISAEILDAAIAVHNSIGGPGNKKSKTAGHASPTVSTSAEGSHKTLCVSAPLR